MSYAVLEGFVYSLRRDLNASDDPRVGSARDNSTSVSPLKNTNPTAPTNSPSFAQFFTTLVPIAVYAAVCVLFFIFFRRKWPRVYAPRTILSSLEPHERTKELPNGWVDWVKVFWNTPDTDVLNHSSLEGYLFLRYMKVLVTICCFGCVLTWPTLIPLHRYGGGPRIELDMLTFGNVVHVNWLYVHAMLAWVFFGFILYMVTRECVYFINLRQAHLLSPNYANRLSSRTVLFTCVPRQVLDVKKLRRIFGDAVKNVWIPREAEDLDALVKEREQTAHRLESAEILLIKKANEAYQKAKKAGHPDIETYPDYPDSPASGKYQETEVTVTAGTESSTSPREFSRTDGTPLEKTSYGFPGPSWEINGSLAAQWIPASQRPRHRPIANYGRRVDTIKWTRAQLKDLAPKIGKLRREYRKGVGKPIPAAFIEFHTQVDAQSAYQTIAHHRANHMRSEIVGIRPQEIIWPALYLPWWERIIRRFLIQAAIAAMVIFWSLPAVAVGMISNIKYLTNKVFFLRWILDLPTIILGLIEGLLPAVMLSLLMSTVPFIMRACARQAGVPTESKVELFVQNSYFVFQIVQVFLITTITSAATSAVTQIIEDPLSARTLLSANLPTASNFYISYFILQGLAMSATRIVHLGSIVRHQLMRNSGGNPRLIAKKYHRLRKIHWGAVYPVFTNMGVIAISYSLIAPIILGVAAIGLGCVYVTYRYNLLYVYSSERDTRGLHYPRALKQTLMGVYLAEICLAGLFGLKGAYGPVVLTFGLVIFSALIHASLNDALSPLLYNLPRTLAAEEELRKDGNPPFLAANLEDKNDNEPEPIDAEGQENNGYDSDFDPSDPANTVDHGEQSSRSIGIVKIEGADRAMNLTTRTLSSLIKKKVRASPIPYIISKIDFWSYWITPDPSNPSPNFILKFLHPEIFADYHILRDQIPEDIRTLEVEYEESVIKDAYSIPSMRNKSPRIWIPRDEPPRGAGISRQEVDHCGKVVEISDEGAWIDGEGLLSVDVDGPTEKWVLRDWERVRF